MPSTLKRLARLGQTICLASALIILGTGIHLALSPFEAVNLLRAANSGVANLPESPVLLAAAATASLPVLLFLYCLFLLWKLFGLAGQRKLYDSDGQSILVRLGALAMITAVLGVVVRMVVALLMTSANPPGQKQLMLAIGSGEIVSLLLGILFFIFSRVLQEASALDRENKSFV